MPVHHAPELKAYEEKVISQLDQAKAKLNEYEAHYKGKKAEAEIQMIRGLRVAHDEIVKKSAELTMLAGKTAADAKVTQIKAEIDAALANFNTKLAQLSDKVHSTTKTS